jgi:serine/threonine protein kinase
MESATFIAYGYEVVRVLGANYSAGRIAYLAKDLESQRLVVVKEFQFAHTGGGGSWDGFKAIEREVQILKQLDHPNIPRYLSSFETDSSCCLVQEYIDGKNLEQLIAERQLYSNEQVEIIVAKLLEILVYLQTNFDTPVFHRDIKPANILIDNEYQPYLIDFGGAKVSLSDGGSTVAGTLGFMAPEQRFGKVERSSDLYGLGLTIICWLAHIQPIAMYDLVDFGTNRIVGWEKLLSGHSQKFISWVEKTIEPSSSKRYLDAGAALNAFNQINLQRQVVQLAPASQFDSGNLRLMVEVDRLSGTIEKDFSLQSFFTGMPDYRWETNEHPGEWLTQPQFDELETLKNHPFPPLYRLAELEKDWMGEVSISESSRSMMLEIDCDRFIPGTEYTRWINFYDCDGNPLKKIELVFLVPSRAELLWRIWSRKFQISLKICGLPALVSAVPIFTYKTNAPIPFKTVFAVLQTQTETLLSAEGILPNDNFQVILKTLLGLFPSLIFTIVFLMITNNIYIAIEEYPRYNTNEMIQPFSIICVLLFNSSLYLFQVAQKIFEKDGKLLEQNRGNVSKFASDIRREIWKDEILDEDRQARANNYKDLPRYKNSQELMSSLLADEE